MSSNAVHINDLTDDQIAALSDEQIDVLVKRRMAEEGIPILPMPVEPEYLDVPGPDLTVYEVAALIFDDRDAAEAVLDVINAHRRALVTTSYGKSYRIRFVERADGEHSVTTRVYYSSAAHAEHQETIDENETRKQGYESALSEYRKAQNEASAVRDEVWEKVNAVHEQRARMAMLTDRLAEYKVLAQGDVLVAVAFLAKAYSITADEEAALYVAEGLPVSA